MPALGPADVVPVASERGSCPGVTSVTLAPLRGSGASPFTEQPKENRESLARVEEATAALLWLGGAPSPAAPTERWRSWFRLVLFSMCVGGGSGSSGPAGPGPLGSQGVRRCGLRTKGLFLWGAKTRLDNRARSSGAVSAAAAIFP